ncbi:MAG: MarR family winged helix-turn-helix transcriptional regulator [Eggerthellaceae bacterium]|jgi:MarR family 2-MHQ and catechol resistance regulon transcriptional repressor
MREEDLMTALHMTVSIIDRKMSMACKAHGLTLGQYAVMQALYRHGSLTIGQLREAAISSDGTISVVIKNLEKRELVERTTRPEDHRCTIISLTDGGRRLFERVCPDRNRVMEKETGMWSPTDQQQLLALLNKFLDGRTCSP